MQQEDAVHPWRRLVSIGDSFTEGIGDPEPSAPGGNRGWADRVAEVLAETQPDFAYANLAIRGRLIQQIVDEQIYAAISLAPDLITFSAGGNDIIRPGADPDQIAKIFDAAVAKLAETGATIVVFNGVDVGFSGTFKALRGKVAIYNENVRGIAAKYGCVLADMWSLQVLHDQRMWDQDRLHLSPIGHTAVARMVLDSLNVPNQLNPQLPGPLPKLSWREARVDDLYWAKEYLIPWVIRRIRHESSGDGLTPKRPVLEPLNLDENK